MITISLFWAVLMLVIIHTILQHLINWGWRYAYEDKASIAMFFAAIIEFVAFIIALYYITN